jgi:hypothetical protein
MFIASQCARSIIQIVWDETRSTLWCLDTAGNWKGLTRLKKSNINLWHSHELGGYDADNRPDLVDVDADYPVSQLVCDGAIVGLGILSDTFTKKSNVWMVVRREIDGDWYWTVETMRGGYVHSTSAYSQILASQMIFTDCSIVHKTTVATATYDVPHLTNQVVRATANSVANGLFALSAGTVVAGLALDFNMNWQTLPNYPGPADGEYWLAFGYAYEALVQPSRLEAGSVIGSAQGAMKRIHKVFVRFYKTLTAKVGSDVDRTESVDFRLGSTPMNKSAQLYTGDKEILLQSDFDRDGFIVIKQDEPLPFGITSLVAEGITFD